ncbi:MAG: glycine zipper 2TM domain-containing protein [Halarcobacter sp.]
MKNIITMISLTLLFIFTACADKNNVAYDSQNYKKIKHISVGKIIHIRDVYIKDSGTGSFLGGVIGVVLGSTIGRGDGRTLASLGGAIVGAQVGSKVNEKNAQELTVQLDTNETIVILSKDTNLQLNDRVRIITVGDEVSSVYKI